MAVWKINWRIVYWNSWTKQENNLYTLACEIIDKGTFDK